MPGPVLTVSKLEKTYPNGTKAVQGVDFAVNEGEIYGILGPNGAGKSTAIGILGTLVRPTGGAAYVDGLDVTKHSLEVRRKIGFAMQEAGVDELATGREYLLLQAKLYGIDTATAKDRMVDLLELFELTEAADKRIGSYSGGMKRRIDLAAALIHVPRFIFLDEPTEGLDPRSRKMLWRTIKRLRKRIGATVLLSTHYMDEADYLCDRIAILSAGKIVVEGTPEELKASVGGQAVVLEYAKEAGTEPVEQAQTTLAGMAGIERLQPTTGGRLFVYVRDAAVATPLILKALDDAGNVPASLSIQRPTLDDVYLKYTGKTIGADEG